MAEKIVNAAIIGARAYTAGEILRILRNHPAVRVTALQARVESPVPVGDVFGALRGAPFPDITDVDPAKIPGNTDVVFLCLPHTAAAQYAGPLLERGLRVIDLSADFRYRDIDRFEKVYGVAHPARDLAPRSEYGLTELRRTSLIGASLIACPGCYPTSVLLAVAPVLRRDMIRREMIVADCKSGVSGAGRNPSDTTHFCAANESFKAYNVAKHRHESEMEEQIARFAGETHNVLFVPHLVPMDRGMFATVYMTLKEPMDEEVIRRVYQSFYEKERFVRFLPPASIPDTKHVAFTNFCDVSIRIDKTRNVLVAMSAIDNLVKGASGQAVQNMNVCFGLEETMGLL